MSNHSPAFWFVVPAAGSGSRMQSTLPKQYLSLCNKTILDHTLSRLLSVPDTAGVVLALSAEDDYFEESNFAKHSHIHCVTGGQERSDSVLAALEFLQGKISEHDWVLVHDAARPCVTLESIQKLKVELSNNMVGGILAVPVSDTLKEVDSQKSILKTIDRRTLWQAQTPQMFRFGILYASLLKANQQLITDEASAVELAGLTAKIIPGQADNIKITHPADLDMAEFILQKQLISGM